MNPAFELVLVIDPAPEAEEIRTLVEAVPQLRARLVPGVAEAVPVLEAHRPRTIVLAYEIPAIVGLEGARLLHVLAPYAAIVLLVDDLDAGELPDVFDAGVTAVLNRGELHQVAAVVRASWHGTRFVEARTAISLMMRAAFISTEPASSLTRRELEVLALLGEGLDPKAIAERLSISVHTARGHVKRILSKLDVHSQLEAVLVASRSGLLPDSL